MSNWVKFKKSHPQLAHFVGDVVEFSDEQLAEYKLYDGGYATPASKDDIAAEVARLEAVQPKMAVVTMQDQIKAQSDEIARLRAQLNGNAALSSAPSAPPPPPPPLVPPAPPAPPVAGDSKK